MPQDKQADPVVAVVVAVPLRVSACCLLLMMIAETACLKFLSGRFLYK
jgi:hypothetical protein